MCLRKKSTHALSYHRAYIRDLEQLFFGCLHERIECAEMLGKFFGSGFAYMPNAKAINEARQCGLLGSFQSIQNIDGRLFGHAV